MSVAVLYVPPTDRPDVLAPSRGGGTVPVMLHGKGDEPGYWTNHPDVMMQRGSRGITAALLLSLDGTPDAIGTGRARELLVAALGGSVEQGSAWHRSGRGYYELWALWTDDRGVARFRSRNFLPYSDVHDADPRNCTMINIAAPYLIGNPGSLAPMAIGDHERALGLALVARIGGSVVVTS